MAINENHFCPSCKFDLRAIDGEIKPLVKNYLVCLSCAAYLKINDDGTLAEMLLHSLGLLYLRDSDAVLILTVAHAAILKVNDKRRDN